jgi:hypothetical protein
MYSCINKRSEREIVSEHNAAKKEKAIKQITFGAD